LITSVISAPFSSEPISTSSILQFLSENRVRFGDSKQLSQRFKLVYADVYNDQLKMQILSAYLQQNILKSIEVETKVVHQFILQINKYIIIQTVIVCVLVGLLIFLGVRTMCEKLG